MICKAGTNTFIASADRPASKTSVMICGGDRSACAGGLGKDCMTKGLGLMMAFVQICVNLLLCNFHT